MNSKLQRIQAMARELGEMFPGTNCDVSFTGSGPSSGHISVAMHNCRDYDHATECLRSLGFDRRGKQVLGVDKDTPSERFFTSVNGWNSEANISATAYFDGTPPTCRIETVTEKIPKRLTVDTGEFIEVERRKVVCMEAA